jgi:hypothetical protein
MSVIDQLRKGFGYMLMCMGVSSPAANQKPPQPPGQPLNDQPAAGANAKSEARK